MFFFRGGKKKSFHNTFIYIISQCLNSTVTTIKKAKGKTIQSNTKNVCRNVKQNIYFIGSCSRAFGAATKAQSASATSLDHGTVKSSCFEDQTDIELERGKENEKCRGMPAHVRGLKTLNTNRQRKT